jgi:hypothetical protein
MRGRRLSDELIGCDRAREGPQAIEPQRVVGPPSERNLGLPYAATGRHGHPARAGTDELIAEIVGGEPLERPAVERPQRCRSVEINHSDEGDRRRCGGRRAVTSWR